MLTKDPFPRLQFLYQLYVLKSSTKTQAKNLKLRLHLWCFSTPLTPLTLSNNASTRVGGGSGPCNLAVNMPQREEVIYLRILQPKITAHRSLHVLIIAVSFLSSIGTLNPQNGYSKSICNALRSDKGKPGWISNTPTPPPTDQLVLFQMYLAATDASHMQRVLTATEGPGEEEEYSLSLFLPR